MIRHINYVHTFAGEFKLFAMKYIDLTNEKHSAGLFNFFIYIYIYIYIYISIK